MSIVLEGAEPPIRINGTAVVLRAVDEGIAVQLTAINVDSFEHLINLVMYNSEDPGRVEAELGESEIAQIVS